MNILSFKGGAIASIFVFIACFAFAALIKYARKGYLSGRSQQEEEKKEVEEKPAPVYYIVERKTNRKAEEYSEPKEIEFK